MTNEEERTLREVIAECRRPQWKPGVHMIPQLEERRNTLADLAERLLKENSELRVRDSNVTAHSLNVLANNEDLVSRKCGTCKHWERDHQHAERGYAVCNQIARELVFETVDDQPEFAWTHPNFTCGLWEKKA